MAEQLPKHLQENILTLLCFSSTAAPLLVASLNAEIFDFVPYRDVAVQAIDFYSQFKEPPKEHIADLLHDQLERKETSKTYTNILEQLFLMKEDINEKYTLSQLNVFIRQQNLKLAIVEAAQLVKEGDLDSAELVLETSRKKRVEAFEPGIGSFDTSGFLNFLKSDDAADSFSTGIAEFDNRGILPSRKELFLLLGAKKKGKSWWLIHLAKQALLARWKVLIITLEMSEKLYARRLIQSLFSCTSREAANIPLTTFEKDTFGRVIQPHTEMVQRPSLRDQKTQIEITKKFEYLSKRMKLIVKQFPTSTLTVQGLKAYLAGLEQYLNFVPDVLILDYPDLMNLDTRNLRIDTGQLYKELRGLAVEKNLALLGVSQGNRESETAKLTTGVHLAEDWSKAGTVDCLLTYSQTPQEKTQNLARLYVDAARNTEDKFMVLISQAYPIGQFCVDSALMTQSYWDSTAVNPSTTNSANQGA